MASLYFKYGTMEAAKTAELLMAKYRYEKVGKKVLVLKTDIDKRDGNDIVKSRVGMKAKARNLSEIMEMKESEVRKYDIILVDEAQFAKAEEIDKLSDIVDFCNIPIICYGLKTDFTTHLFEGSKRLLEIAENISEIKNICWCGKKSIYNARIIDGKIVTGGEVVSQNVQYIPLCRKHFKLGLISNEC